jgi:nucleoside-diphosphate-sugar epimerase
MNNKQTILGSGGGAGSELEKALSQYTNDIRLVSRNPKAAGGGKEPWPADLTSRDDIFKAVEGSAIVYLMVGLKYDIRVWESQWPQLVRNVIDACKSHGAKLVFFDNIYMYDKNFLNGMTEETPINPPSRKGKVRERIAKMIMDEASAGTLTALIARSADFYGPGLKTSMLTETVFKPLAAGKKANWMGSVNFKHSFTYTPDAGKATALLGNTPDAYGQVWHLPTAPDPFTGKQWIGAIAAAMGKQPKFQAAPKLVVQVMGLFMPIMKEMVEMLYQYDRDYVFDSGRFEKRFGFKPTPYLDGIREVVEINYELRIKLQIRNYE